ncbi:MAG: Fic/DOC family protein [Candidatus Nanopelagicales bacterium]
MSGRRPWTIGDHEARWNGYLIAPDSPVLRNLVHATTVEALSAAEDDLVEFRLAELRERPALVPRTYDLGHLRALHHQLFQDVYEWAGELRTVGLAKGSGDSFMPPMQIERPMAHATARVADSDLLRSVPAGNLAREVAYLYDYVNFAHPFREGNGRSQREFFAQLLAESGHGLEWGRTEMSDLHHACHVARNEDDLAPLTRIVEQVLTESPSY